MIAVPPPTPIPNSPFLRARRIPFTTTISTIVSSYFFLLYKVTAPTHLNINDHKGCVGLYKRKQQQQKKKPRASFKSQSCVVSAHARL